VNHEEATRYLDDLGELVPDRRPPMTDLIRSGKFAERRMTRKTSALVAAAVALIFGGGAVVQLATTGDDGKPAEQRTADVHPTTPTAPDGMRLVGMSGVAVAVPDSWVTAENGCARETGVVWRYPDNLDASSSGNCPEPPSSGYWASLGVGDLNSVEGRHLSPEMTIDGEPVQGAAVREGSGSDDYQAPQYCGPVPGSAIESCSLLFGVPSRGVFFSLKLRDENAQRQLDAIRGSLQLLPDGYTTVPFIQPGTLLSEAEAMIEAAGLQSASNALGVDEPVEISDPLAGSVVRVGDLVTFDDRH
jgi:hypothetical protein